MGYLYFDESIRDKGGFIIGAAVYSSCDLTSHVHQQWESLGLNPLQYEYKSSALKAGNTAAEEQRCRLHAVLSRTKIGLVVSPTSHRKELGAYAVALINQLLEAGSIPREPHTLYLDQNIRVSNADKALAGAMAVSLQSNQNSRIAAGIQLADLAAHSLGGMLLEGMGLLSKTVRAGEGSGYDPETQIEIGFELWVSLRYMLFGSPMPVRAAVGDDSIAYPVFKVEGYGLYIAPSCPDNLRAYSRSRFGENYLGCIH